MKPTKWNKVHSGTILTLSRPTKFPSFDGLEPCEPGRYTVAGFYADAVKLTPVTEPSREIFTLAESLTHFDNVLP